jgi:glycyl-tRNA synthetase
MQDAILTLQRYWTERGCLLAQPFNTEVGAGTMNPATILRVLGPEPWHVAYVEPSVRPDDSRYGENPNRLQTHTQFQVILKPDPGNPQELYLGSLRALGIDIEAHDVRFVEDNWASPALGAWGLGWEVWLDGLEITQFTYFQQAGGLTVNPVAVEITYGLERILMPIQGVSHFKDISYAPGISYGEVFGQSEYEMSRYYLDDADLDTNRRLFEEYAAEARRMVDARLPVPAHSYVLKCSHTFNVLDARGAISTTERARAFARMRGLAREVATLWVERRKELDFPLGTIATPEPAIEPTSVHTGTEPATLLFEIGTEELPPAEVGRTASAVREALERKLDATRLGHGAVTTYGTPRRIVAIVADVEAREPDATRTQRGPRVSAAFGSDGSPTKAGEGFARGKGVSVADLGRITVDGVEHVAVTSVEAGRGAVDVLSTVLAETVSELRSERNMRWNDPKLSFSRPIRWLLAMLGHSPVPVVCSALVSGTTTRVHRTADPSEIEVHSADEYLDLLAEHDITLDSQARRTAIVETAGQLAAEAGGVVDIEAESALVDEITNLVEQPYALLGSFSADYLQLPEAILTTVMRKHQRYLPVRSADGQLLAAFVAVANGCCDPATVRAGNEAVLRARYEDAAFFWRADLKVAPAELRQGLEKLTFEERLGSMADRADRIATLAAALADLAGLNDADRETVRRAGQLAKFDLASQMVVELSSLAGIMAREYALRAGESEAVAQALYEMELPRHANDSLPRTIPGAVLALADRFDLLTGLLAVGATPSGSSDPFGLRRSALGIASILRSFEQLTDISVSAGLDAASLVQDKTTVSSTVVDTAADLVTRRYQQQLLDTGHDHRLVRAVLPYADRPAAADVALTELESLVNDAEFVSLAEALQRVRRILPAGIAATYDPARLALPAETALHEALTAVTSTLDGQLAGVRSFFAAATVLTGPINTFFDDVLVMDPDPEIRKARQGLLATVDALAAGVLDWNTLGTDL